MFFGHEASEKTRIYIGGNAIEVKIKRHTVGRSDAQLDGRAVQPELTSIRQEKPVNADASSIGIDIQRAIKAHNVQLSSVRTEPQTAK